MIAQIEDRPLDILLVEDDEVDVMNVRRALAKTKLKHTFCTASDGLEALEILGQSKSVAGDAYLQHRRLILLDLNMPRMGGIEFLRELRQQQDLQSIPVIVLTTSDEESDRAQAYRFNVAGYILKPVTFSQFLSMVSRLGDYWAMCEMP